MIRNLGGSLLFPDSRDRLCLCLAPLLVLLAAAPALAVDAKITTPKEFFGFDLGDDYQLANYTQISRYWRKIEAESDRISVQEIGETAWGRPQLMAIVTSPENHKNLARYREISRKLALAEGLTDEDARALSREGKAVVWIDGGLHATETLGAQQLCAMVYRMVSGTDRETLRFLDDLVMLFVHANPDGNELVADWYMREPDPRKRDLSGVPELYQKYIGHDNNRDFFASTQAETENINRVLYREWFPQILYNHHQSGPAGTVLWSPPLRDPYNYNLDPLIILGLQSVGAALHTRLAVEGKPGATMRNGGPYDGWWNGGIRNTATFHNIIAILTEMIGNPTPMRIPFVLGRQLPSSDLPFPIEPQEWHFRQSVEYSLATNRAVLDYASRMKENLLFNVYRMGRNSIERGSRDSWTASPSRYQRLGERMAGAGGAGDDPARDAEALAELRMPRFRDPRGYILPSDQPDFPTATKFINALLETGITVHRASKGFTVLGKRYPADSYVVLTAQAFRPHIIDMFEPQDHPNVVPFPGAPPTPPYDNAGWTLALQMGVQFDRVLDGFTGPFEKIQAWNVRPPPGRVAAEPGADGYVTSRRVNDAVIAVNRLLAAGERVVWLKDPVTTISGVYPAGAFFVAAGSSTGPLLDRLAADLGIVFDAARGKPPAGSLELHRPRVALWDQYGGSMESGWTRWILERFEFSFDRIYAPELDAGNLGAKFDVLILVDGAIPGEGGRGGRRRPERAPAEVPQPYRSRMGRITRENTLPQIRDFIQGGGTVIALGDTAANLAGYLNLPIGDHLSENGVPLPRTKFFTPGSVVSMRVDTTQLLTAGMDEHTNTFFDNSPVFRLAPDAAARHVQALSYFDTGTPLRSGWSWGQQYLEGGVTAVEAELGLGRVFLFGPAILQRAQPHASFKLLFNAVLYAGARTVGSDRNEER